MNTIYVIMAIYKTSGTTGISQEVYSSLEDAQEFCASRVGAKQCTPHFYESEDFAYLIKECTLKD